MKKAAISGAVVALFVMMLGTFDVAAQSNEEFDKVFPFVGHWNILSTNTEGEDRGN